jgi:crotonobetainyl-CoA:carnitine CoA-transferase CaiB-like acyl-CoA transferase
VNEQHPLAGLRVLDLGQIYQGPYAGFLLAQAGAEVVKLEPLEGERLRTRSAVPPLPLAMFNSNKLGITLDLKQPRGVALMKRLVREFDVLLENFAPGVMDKLGVGWDVLKHENERLIYATGSGYGISGPDRDQLAMDHTIQAVTGVMSLTGMPGGPPIRAGAQFADILGAVNLYAAIVTALQLRHRTGKGTLVETSMVEACYPCIATELGHLQRTGEIPKPVGSRSASQTTPYGVFRCQDGHLAMICVKEVHWQRLTEVIGKPELVDDARFRTNADRYANESVLNPYIDDWCAQRTRDAAIDALRAKRIPVAPVRNIDEVRRDPHMHARGALEWVEHPDMGRMVLQRSPLRFPEIGLPELRLFPKLGEHNREVYCGWVGLSAAEFDALVADRVI